MTATKSGNHIYVAGTGNTLTSITADIADTTFIEETSPGVFTVKGNVARYLRIRSGGVLTIGNPTDYSVAETLQFENLAANNTRFYVDANGELAQYGNTMIDFSISSNRSYYTYIYGKTTVLGDATYQPVWQNYQRIYMYETSLGNTYTNDVWHFENMIIGSAFTTGYYAFYFQGMGKVREHVFRNITFDKSYGRGMSMYCFRMAYIVSGAHKMTFEDLKFVDVGNYPIYGGMDCRWSNCVFSASTNRKLYLYNGFGAAPNTLGLRDYGLKQEHFAGQRFTLIEDCTFENIANVNDVYVRYGTVALFKDNDFQATSGERLQLDYQGLAMMWNNTITQETFDVNSGSTIQWVYGLDLTIEDRQGNPIEGAFVHVEQSEGKERFVFETKANGKLDQMHDLEVALLTNLHQYGNSKTSNSEYWSDASNSTSHQVVVFKDGYRPAAATFVMDADKSSTIQLDRMDAHANVF